MDSTPPSQQTLAITISTKHLCAALTELIGALSGGKIASVQHASFITVSCSAMMWMTWRENTLELRPTAQLLTAIARIDPAAHDRLLQAIKADDTGTADAEGRS